MKNYTYKFISQLPKLKNNDNTGWVIHFGSAFTKQDLIDIGIELHEKINIPSLVIGKEHNLVVENTTNKNDNLIRHSITLIINAEIERIYNTKNKS